MAKTNAELQKAFKQRSELDRLDIRIEGGAKRALARLAAHHGITQSTALSELILKAERDVLSTLDKSSHAAFMACEPVKIITR
jgi:hypothetical protein